MKKFVIILIFIFCLSGKLIAVDIKLNLNNWIIKQSTPEVSIKGNWLLEKNFDYLLKTEIMNKTKSESIIINIKYILESNDKFEKYLLKEYKNLEIKGDNKSISFIISQNILKKLKPKEYVLQVVLSENGKEEIVDKKENITIMGYHIDKVKKVYIDMTFKNEKKISTDWDKKNNILIQNLKWSILSNNREWIGKGRKLFYKKGEKLQITFELKNSEFDYPKTGVSVLDSDDEKPSNKNDFIGDILIYLTGDNINGYRDGRNTFLKKEKNVYMEPGCNWKKYQCEIDTAKFDKGIYQLIVFCKNQLIPSRSNIPYDYQNAIFPLVIGDFDLLESYKVKINYYLKESTEGSRR